jgi:Sec-independent protein translocase protein TatA
LRFKLKTLIREIGKLIKLIKRINNTVIQKYTSSLSLSFQRSQTQAFERTSEPSKMSEQSKNPNEDSEFIEKLLVEILTQPSADKDRNVQRILHRVRCLEGLILGFEKALEKMEKKLI